eukprot:2984520-Prymnesium_polylepis.2
MFADFAGGHTRAPQATRADQAARLARAHPRQPTAGRPRGAPARCRRAAARASLRRGAPSDHHRRRPRWARGGDRSSGGGRARGR